ncbi:MAG: TIGR02186 family protein [Rhodospirillaceae bacterium]|nr:TIGR02186 family protein [Rhodospirillaceae bacterium]
MRRVLQLLGMAVVAAAIAMPAASRALAQEHDEPLLIALSTQRIEIDSNFAGTSILLFGATDVAGDVVVSVRGPEEPVVVRRKRRSVGIWVNRESIAFRNVPGYYFVATSGPLEEIAPVELLDRKQLGSERVLLEAIWFDTSGDADEFRAALHRDRERDSLYRSEPGVVEFIDERLFRTTIDLPAHVPTGDYVVEAMLLVDSEVLSTRSAALSIEKAGFSADISTFARADEALYGVIAIALALVAGWLGSFAFRKG